MSCSEAAPLVETVVKLGGGVLASADVLEPVLAAIDAAAPSHPVLIVPGGGPFADAVRDIDRRLGLSDAASHWMAVLAMDQHAYLITDRLQRFSHSRRGRPSGRPSDGLKPIADRPVKDALASAELVTEPREIAEAIAARRIPVLAPFRWLRNADPLPHSWDVTSDSIAAWVAGRIGARSLVLVKPRGADSSGALVDPYFARALPAGVSSVIVTAAQLDRLRSALLPLG